MLEALEGFRLSPATRELAEARGWLDRFESLGLDGVVAKRLGVAVPAGFARRGRQGEGAQDRRLRRRRRPLEGDREAIATLLLGLYREDGGLDYVGSCAVAASRRDEVAERVLPLVEEDPGVARLRAEPRGTGELEQTRCAAGARRRGAVRQGAGRPLPPRHQADPLARRQGAGRLHLARAAPAAHSTASVE